MKNKYNRIFVLLFVLCIFLGCVSTQSSKEKYVLVFDPMIKDTSVYTESWLIYASKIEEDMETYYSENPNGKYTISYDAELSARRFMMFFYAVAKQKNSEINDNYFEELVKINEAKYFDEYVFICFNHNGWENPGNWKTDKELKIDEWADWMKNNLPNHIPLTLVHVEKK